MARAAKFEWNNVISSAVRKHVQQAVERLSPVRYRQEAAYIAALAGRLDGVAYDGPDGRVEFLATTVDDRGPNSAESRWGADFTITATLQQGGTTVHKAVLGQAKRGSVVLLSAAERTRLDGQCRDMLRATEDCLVLETPVAIGMQPRVQILGARPEPDMDLSDYFANQLITCLHGDTRTQFIISALTSRLTNLHLSVTQ